MVEGWGGGGGGLTKVKKMSTFFVCWPLVHKSFSLVDDIEPKYIIFMYEWIQKQQNCEVITVDIATTGAIVYYFNTSFELLLKIARS